MEGDRSWMYERADNGYLSDVFSKGVDEFIDFAFSQTMGRDKIKCPCFRCGNRRFLSGEEVKYHLHSNGFTSGYTQWTAHGEPFYSSETNVGETSVPPITENYCQQPMLIDAMGPEMYNDYASRDQFANEEHVPNEQAAKFFKLLEEADKPIFPGCHDHTKLSTMARLLNLKTEYNLPTACYDRMLSIIKAILPEGNQLEETFYRTKKMMSSLGLGVVKIHVCINDCMLYYKETQNLTQCPKCGSSRYKEKVSRTGHRVPRKVLRYLPLTPRLQRLYMSRHTAEHMTWHSKNQVTRGEMSHPVHSEAWKHFDRTYPLFGLDPRSVRLGLCTDGFNPFSMSNIQYSCWPVIMTVYNLPPWMCMKQDNMFLSMVIPGRKSPGKDLDIYLRPLIDELQILWHEGVETYDIHTKQNFQMRAALMWTISDFPGYGMLSGWSTHGPKCCPYCMGQSKSFMLKNGGKTSFFDCHRRFLLEKHGFRRQGDKFYIGRVEKDEPIHRPTGDELRHEVNSLPDIPTGKFEKRPSIEGFGQSHNWVRKSIFWELPYWHTNLIRHNLDVMHIEKNVFDNIFNTIMDVKGRTKDNFKSRKDLELYCSRSELHLQQDRRGKLYMPKAAYSLTKEQRRDVCTWIKNLRMPDGYALNIARCVKDDFEVHGMKSHDCHIFMQRLLPIVFKDILPKPIWEVVTEVSHFFRDICSTVLRTKDMEQLEQNIVVTLCKLEKIFPPSFFDSMEHLPIHLAYEAKVGGPVQFRWMYPFERFLHHLKKKVTNRAHVEASIVEAYLVEETSLFCSLYFEKHEETRLTRVPRNDDGGLKDSMGRLSIFTHLGRPIGNQRSNSRLMTDKEYNATTLYVLLNCTEIRPYVEDFDKCMRTAHTQLTDTQLDHLRQTHFISWLRQLALNGNIADQRIQAVALGPSRTIKFYNGYFVNGFKFHTMDYGQHKITMNSGVCVLGSVDNGCETNWYGLITEILELDYLGGSGNKVTLFKCEWFDNATGVTVHRRFGLVEINKKKKLVTDDAFILANQAQQVYYTNFPPTTTDRRDWWAVVKTKARNITNIEGIVSGDEPCDLWVELAFQEDRPLVAPQPARVTVEFNRQTLVREDVDPEEVYENEVDENEENDQDDSGNNDSNFTSSSSEGESCKFIVE